MKPLQKVEAYKTSDGRLFESPVAANAYEQGLEVGNKIDKLFDIIERVELLYERINNGRSTTVATKSQRTSNGTASTPATRIYINGKPVDWFKPTITRDEVLRLYRGMNLPDKSYKVVPLMNFRVLLLKQPNPNQNDNT